MKIRNKKTGEIGYLLAGKTSHNYFVTNDEWDRCGIYNSLAELNSEWEDAPEEPKEYWYIDYDGEISCGEFGILTGERGMVSIGNHFKTREEAVKALRKLEAWKRLKDKGFRFDDWERDKEFSGDYIIKASDYHTCDDKDLDLLFGGEE